MLWPLVSASCSFQKYGLKSKKNIVSNIMLNSKKLTEFRTLYYFQNKVLYTYCIPKIIIFLLQVKFLLRKYKYINRSINNIVPLVLFRRRTYSIQKFIQIPRAVFLQISWKIYIYKYIWFCTGNETGQNRIIK